MTLTRPAAMRLLELVADSRQPDDLIPDYGAKTANLVRLARFLRISDTQRVGLRGARVPDALCIPRNFDVPADALTAASKKLARILGAIPAPFYAALQPARYHQHPILVRSSDCEHEGAGQFDSPIVVVNRRDPAAAFAQCIDKVRAIQRQHSSQALTIMPMTGVAQQVAGAGRCFGWDHVAFVVDSHAAFAPDEIAISLGLGLGESVVGTANRATLQIHRAEGYVTGANTATPAERMTRQFHRQGAATPASYVQQIVPLWSLENGQAIRVPVTNELLSDNWFVAGGTLHNAPIPSYQRLHRHNEWKKNVPELSSYLGLAPRIPLAHILAIRDLANQCADDCGMPVQIEGGSIGGALYCYQLLPIPTHAQRAYTFSHCIDPTQYSATFQTLGAGKFVGPMLVTTEIYDNFNAVHRRFRTQYGDRPYAVVVNPAFGAKETAYFQDAQVLLSEEPLTSGTHLVTHFRQRLGIGESVLVGGAIGLGYNHAEIIPLVAVESNSRELRVRILQAE